MATWRARVFEMIRGFPISIASSWFDLFCRSYNVAYVLLLHMEGQLCTFHPTSRFMILSSRVISVLRYIQATLPGISIPCTAITSAARQKPEQAHPALCTQLNILARISTLCVT